MQKFLKYSRIEPKTKDIQSRIKNYAEIYSRYDSKNASHQASRCIQCSNAYCSYGCPLDNHIPQWLQAVAKDDLELAFSLSNQTSPFPEIMGKICPQDRLCEKSCTLNENLGAITIGSIESYITQEGFDRGFKIKFKDKIGKKVAIVGSGPASLSAATFLLKDGVDVDMYEKADRAGGLLTYGIPNFKLEKQVVQNRIDNLIQNGMNIYLNKEVGVDISFEQLQKDYDSVFIGIGANDANAIDINNINANNVYNSMDILIDNQKALFENKKPKLSLEDKKVVVIGGGDTAMDCVRTAIRQNALSATCLYRRDENSMPGSKKEYKNASQEGTLFGFNLSPSEILVDNENNVTSIKMQKTSLQDSKLVMLDEYETYDADVVIMALGFHLKAPEFIVNSGMKLSKWGTIEVDNYETSIKNVYAGGDCYRGANLVVNAALDGREAAKVILQNMQEK